MAWQDYGVEHNLGRGYKEPIINILKPDIPGKVKVRASIIEDGLQHSAQQYYPLTMDIGFVMKDIVRQLYLGIAGRKIDNYLRESIKNEIHKP